MSVFITTVSPKGGALIPNEGREGGEGAGGGGGGGGKRIKRKLTHTAE